MVETKPLQPVPPRPPAPAPVAAVSEPQPPPANVQLPAPAANPADAIQAIVNDPAVKKTMETFQARIVHVEPRRQ